MRRLPVRTAEERQSLKDSLPRTILSLQHTKECRVVPDRLALLDFLPKGGVVAEIGVAGGDYSAEILRRSRPMRLHLSDAWHNPRFASQLVQVQTRFEREIEEEVISIERGLSIDVLESLPDAYFDWVYIDTDHTFDTTFKELSLCDRKVKADGYIAGHDFCSGNVISAVPYGVIEACLKFCVDFGWQFAFLTLEFGGHQSFALKRL
jgi:hypothetical protein